jgi:hypothetical protein
MGVPDMSEYECTNVLLWGLYERREKEGRRKVARFWTWHLEGYVRLTVREGKELRWSTRGPTDEGWSSREEIWSLVQGNLWQHIYNDGVDCDGRLSTESAYMCPVDKLAAFLCEDKDLNPSQIRCPSWERRRSSQRDYSAEAAGY